MLKMTPADFVILCLFVGCRILIYFLRLSGTMHSLSHFALVVIAPIEKA